MNFADSRYRFQLSQVARSASKTGFSPALQVYSAVQPLSSCALLIR